MNPPAGIDVAAKAEVHHADGRTRSGNGKAILMISSDLPEVLAISDRILVMRQGRLTGEFTRTEATQEKIMSAATGQENQLHDSPAEPGRLRPEIPVIRTWSTWLGARELGIAGHRCSSASFSHCLLDPHFAWPRQSPQCAALYSTDSDRRNGPDDAVIISRNIDLSVGSILGFSLRLLLGKVLFRAMLICRSGHRRSACGAGVGALLGIARMESSSRSAAFPLSLLRSARWVFIAA